MNQQHIGKGTTQLGPIPEIDEDKEKEVIENEYRRLKLGTPPHLKSVTSDSWDRNNRKKLGGWLTEYIEDPGYVEKILKEKKCPYCDYSLRKPYPTKRECESCDFILYGNPKLVAYKTQPSPMDYTYKLDKCPECKSKHLFYEMKEKELVCLDCGLVCTSQHRYVGYRRVDYPFGLHLDYKFFL